MKIFIEPDVRLFVDIEGAGLVADGARMRQKPTLILLHGGPGFDHAGFKPAFSCLADLVQLVYYDQRGHGRSDPRPRQEWTLDTYADDVVRLCDALGIDKPIVLGQSFGGFVAQRYMARHPRHPAKVILSSTSGKLGLARKLAMFELLGGAAARDAAERFWTMPGEATFERYWSICKPLYTVADGTGSEAAARATFNKDILFAWSGGELQSMDLLPALSSAQCPVLVMAGARDPVCPLADARDIVAALPASLVQFAQFDNCGHGVWRDDPDAAFACLRHFINR